VRAGVAGLVTSAVVWFLVAFVPYLRFFLAILVGVAVGEVMSRLARRRVSRALEVVAVIDVILGLLMVEAVASGSAGQALSDLALDQATLIASALPAAIASFVAVVKLR
jgi:predicted PurR-regulated permease PerM